MTSQKAVLAFREFCVDQKWPFTEIPQQTDFGKDGYLDFSESGNISGLCIAVQIKGGVSLRRVGDFVMRAKSSHRRLWWESTIPVFGVLWDPNSALYWVNLTDLLRRDGQDTPIKIPRTNRLDKGGLSSFLTAARIAAERPPSMVALGSADVELQTAAIWDCYGLGRRDPEYLILLRRVMFHLESNAINLAIEALDTCSLNQDKFIDPKWMGTEQRKQVRQSFRWSVDEAVVLLDRVYDDGNGYFGRGSFGSCVYWLIVGSEPLGEHFISLVEAATWRAINEDKLHAAAMGLALWCYWLGDQAQALLGDVLEQRPNLANHEEIALIVDMITTDGKIVL